MNRAQSRGVTLVELMISIGASLIASGAIMGVIGAQHKTAVRQLPIAQAHQNARASLALIRRYLRNASFGVRATTTAAGFAPVGACYNDSGFTEQQFNCDNIDPDNRGGAGVDRLQLAYIKSIPGNLTSDDLGTDVGLTAVDGVNSLDSGGTPLVNHPFTNDKWLLLSGPCEVTGTPSVDLLRVTNAVETPAASGLYRYTYADPSGGTTTACGVNAYADNSAVGLAQFVDLNVVGGVLRLRTDPRVPPAQGFVVARNVDDFQVQYLLDILDSALPGPGTDGVFDTVCDDLSELSCAPSLATPRLKANHVIGIRVAIVVRTSTFDSAYDRGTTDNMAVQNHIGTGGGDGYSRWVYRTTVMLRNNQL